MARAFTDNHKFRGGKGGHGAPDGGLCWTREARRMGCAGLRIDLCIVLGPKVKKIGCLVHTNFLIPVSPIFLP